MDGILSIHINNPNLDYRLLLITFYNIEKEKILIHT